MRTTSHELEQVSTRDLLDEVERIQRSLRSRLEPLGGAHGGAFTPAADIEETDDAFVVEIELAGVRRGDIDITTTGRRLVVTGERTERERVGIIRRRDRVVGRFRYEVELPSDLDAGRVTAGFEDGVLSVHLPKSAVDRPRRVTID